MPVEIDEVDVTVEPERTRGESSPGQRPAGDRKGLDESRLAAELRRLHERERRLKAD